MTQTMTLMDILELGESVDLECKAAQGRNGRGEVPEDFWKSYSAMANTHGGVILLGVQEAALGTFQAVGVADVERIRKALWDNLHNRKQISVTQAGESTIQPVLVDGKTILRVEVQRAARQTRPVHLGVNPFGGTYLRRYEGDYLADDETVRRMLAERVEDSRDERVLKGFAIGELDLESVAAYRNRFSAVKPGHVWLDLPLDVFLERIGAYGKNREEGFSGLRLAGLLMFGRAEVIRDALPNYMVDFQERPEAKTERRWIDRLVPDGTWSGNVYDFFRRVYQKLTADLKVPFQLKEGQRIEDTPVHEALREALVNTLIHADFSGRMSVLVVKRPDMFGFRNPGLMRVPPAVAVHGGHSDCRNRRLQTMFQFVGYGDHAGSGLPKIYNNWAGQHWRRPVLHEMPEPEQTLMELRMTSLLPPAAVADLESHLGERFSSLTELERLALVMAATEGVVNHARLRDICTEHPTDITKMLARLVRDGLLLSDGVGRGMVYGLPWGPLARVSGATVAEIADDPFVAVPTRQAAGPSGDAPSLTPELGALSPELPSLTPELGSLAQELGRASGHPIVPVIADLGDLEPAERGRLLEIAEPERQRKRSNPADLKTAVLAVCQGHYLGLRVLSALLGRDGDDLRKRTLNPLVASGDLQRAYPSPSDPRQGYMTTPERTS
jgi:ATP-dependent DNA helicase RecG